MFLIFLFIFLVLAIACGILFARALPYLIAGGVLLYVIASVVPKATDQSTTVSLPDQKNQQPPATADPVVLARPADEADMLRRIAIVDNSLASERPLNDIVRDQMQDRWDRQFCSAIGKAREIANWTGRVREIRWNGYFEVELDPEQHVVLVSSDLARGRALQEPVTVPAQLFKAISGLSKGQPVRFSGYFDPGYAQGVAGCYANMVRDFTVRLTSVEPLVDEALLAKPQPNEVTFPYSPPAPENPAATASITPPEAPLPTSPVTMYDRGLADRAAWENWFNGLEGDFKTGAFFWARQRSLPHPGSCSQMNVDFYDGCVAAKERLAAADALRISEPDYKRGWNAYVPPGASSDVGISLPAEPEALAHPPSGTEMLPEEISGVMDKVTDNSCPTWNNPTKAKEIIVHLTAVIRVYTDSIRKMTTAYPEQAPTHVRAVTACRDALARELGMTGPAVQQLYDYNVLTNNEEEMFHDLEMDNYQGQPDFSKLLAMPNKRQALHIVDLEIREMNYSINQFRAMIAEDAGKPTEETDRNILSNESDFREKLVSLHTSIAGRLGEPPSPRPLSSSETSASTSQQLLGKVPVPVATPPKCFTVYPAMPPADCFAH
jgi:hypothetical protein